MISGFVNTKSISSGTDLGTFTALIARGLDVFRLNVEQHTLSGGTTVQAHCALVITA